MLEEAPRAVAEEVIGVMGACGDPRPAAGAATTHLINATTFSSIRALY
jgi:hypothetical protein